MNRATLAVSLKKSNRNSAKKERHYSNLRLTVNYSKLYNGNTFLKQHIPDNICGLQMRPPEGNSLQNETQLLCLLFTKNSWL